jgi:carbonic anhydrase
MEMFPDWLGNWFLGFFRTRGDITSKPGPKVLFPSSAYGLAIAMASFPQQLLDGYRTFTTQRLPTEQSRYRELSVRGQSPEVMVIGCCDSRVSPEVIFDAGPGELFVMRNIANLVPVYQPDANAHGVSAALEFAVSVLRVKHIVVLGHAQCGGIRAFIDKAAPLSPGDFIGKWMAMFIKPGEKVEQRSHETMQDFTVRIEKAAVFRSLENLMTFPFVRSAVERGEMALHGAYFGVAEGSLFVLDPVAKEFKRANGE